jgi:hypothetical protein
MLRGHGAQRGTTVEVVAVVRGIGPVDRLEELSAVDRLSWLGALDLLDRFLRVDLFDRLGRVLRVDHVLPPSLEHHARRRNLDPPRRSSRHRIVTPQRLKLGDTSVKALTTPTPNRKSKLTSAKAIRTTLICGVLIAACGTASIPGGASASGGPLLKEAQCMRAHGIANFPDPRPTGGLVIPNNIDTNAPVFKSAQRACSGLSQPASLRPGGSESRKLQLLALARCMREHGVPSFSDPTTSPPPPSSGNAIGGDGWFLSLGSAQERRSPAYKSAAIACQLTLR